MRDEREEMRSMEHVEGGGWREYIMMVEEGHFLSHFFVGGLEGVEKRKTRKKMKEAQSGPEICGSSIILRSLETRNICKNITTGSVFVVFVVFQVVTKREKESEKTNQGCFLRRSIHQHRICWPESGGSISRPENAQWHPSTRGRFRSNQNAWWAW